MSRLPGEKLKKSYFIFLDYCPLHFNWLMPFANLQIENLKQRFILKTITASSLIFGQLIEDGK